MGLLHTARYRNKKNSDNLEAQETPDTQRGENKQKGKWHVTPGPG